jgi:flagellar basal-body rod protein FlgB
MGTDPTASLVARKLLDVQALRHDAIAANIANAETPGYKRVDLDPDFDAQLKDAVQKHDRQAIKNLTPTIVEDRSAKAVRPDGNTVVLEKELMIDNQTAVNYDFLDQYLSMHIQQMQQAARSN